MMLAPVWRQARSKAMKFQTAKAKKSRMELLTMKRRIKNKNGTN
jgi:hypothetical protein